jgi:hypothetical protein
MVYRDRLRSGRHCNLQCVCDRSIPDLRIGFEVNMTEKSYYIEFRFISQKERHIRREAVVEVPKDLVRRK